MTLIVSEKVTEPKETTRIYMQNFSYRREILSKTIKYLTVKVIEC